MHITQTNVLCSQHKVQENRQTSTNKIVQLVLVLIGVKQVVFKPVACAIVLMDKE